MKVAIVPVPFEPLHNYLRDRYADRLVLTFAEIEDLLGITLPDDAKAEGAWWDTPGPHAPRSAQADAWVLAGRTAAVNMGARTVVFERNGPVSP
jgi:hypothetical protein